MLVEETKEKNEPVFLFFVVLLFFMVASSFCCNIKIVFRETEPKEFLKKIKYA